MNFKPTKLENLCAKVYSGGTPTSSNEDYYGGEIPWLRTQEVLFNNIFETDIKITESGLKNSSAKLVPKNSVIVAMYGNSAGRVAINKIPLTTNQACCNLIIDPTKADYRYVFFSLKNKFVALKSLAKGAAQNNLNASQVKSFEIGLPELDIQRNVADNLSNYDALIENNNRRIALLEESARLLYQEWFVHLRFPGHEHCKIIDGVPDGWSNKRIDSFGDVVTGKTPSTKKPDYYDGNILFVKTPDMHGNFYALDTEQKLTEEGAKTQINKFIPKNSIMISCIGTLGVVSLSVGNCQTNQQINTLVPNNLNEIAFLLFAFKALKPKLESFGGGATMANVNKSKFSSIEILRPNEKLTFQFQQNVQSMLDQILNLQQQNVKLTEARDILLPRLMNGEIVV